MLQVNWVEKRYIKCGGQY